MSQPGENTFSSIKLKYHGNCSHCHHFQRRRFIQVSLNNELHRTYQCNYCGHTLFGLGGNESHTSIASEYTLQDAGPEGQAVRDPPMVVSMCNDLSHPYNSPAHIHSNAPEGNPSQEVATQSRFSVSLPQLILESRHDSSSRSALAANTANDPHAQPLGQILEPKVTRSSPRSETASRLKMLAKRLFTRRKLPYQQSAPATKTTSVPSTTDQETMTDLTMADMETENRQIIPLATRLITAPDETTDERFHEISEENRLTQQRREATLRKQKLERRMCFCSANCHCMTVAGHPETGSVNTWVKSHIPTDTIFDRIRNQGVDTPSEPQAVPMRHGSPSRHVQFAGTHFEDGVRQSGNVDHSTPESIRRRQSRQTNSTETTQLSQATTVVTSSSSGSRSSRSANRRTYSFPGMASDTFFETLRRRPHILEAFQDLAEHLQPPQSNSTPQAILEQTRREASAEGNIPGQAATDVDQASSASGGPTSLANMPNPDDEQASDRPTGTDAETVPPSHSGPSGLPANGEDQSRDGVPQRGDQLANDLQDLLPRQNQE